MVNPFRRPKIPPPSRDRAIEVAMVQEAIFELAPGLRQELDALEATLIRQQQNTSAQRKTTP